MKVKGRVSKKPPTEKQLAQQAKISMVSKFVYSMKLLLDKSFIGYAERKTGTNAAFSYNYKNCLAGDYSALVIDYSMVLVSRGDLPNYRGVDEDIVFNVVKIELPKLKLVLIEFLKVFPKNEVAEVLETKQYNHLKGMI